MNQPTTLLCLVCQRREYDRPWVCESDRDSIPRTLTNIRELSQLLDATQRRKHGGTQPVSGKSELWPSPLNIDALDLAAPNRPETLALNARGILGLDPDQTGLLSADTILSRIGSEWDTYRGWSDRRDMGCSYSEQWLAERSVWACDHYPDIADNVKELRELETTLRRITQQDEDDRQRIGLCPGSKSRPCGTPLRATPWQDSTECPACGKRWPRITWLNLNGQAA